MGRLDGKVAIVTGAYRGFGEAIAMLFAEEGAAVAICDILPAKELDDKVGTAIRARGGKVLCLQIDVSKEDQVNKMVKEIIKKFGTVDILVNNVGLAGPTKDFWDLTWDEWNHTVTTNMGSVFLCCKAVMPEMMRKKYGRIVNISSVTGKNPLAHRTPYASSKMGIIGFGRTAAVDAGKYNVTVNTICPAAGTVERGEELSRARAEYLGQKFDVEAYKKRIAAQVSEKAVLGGRFLAGEGYTGKALTRDDVAPMVLFYVSDESKNITGQDVNVDGGWVMW